MCKLLFHFLLSCLTGFPSAQIPRKSPLQSTHLRGSCSKHSVKAWAHGRHVRSRKNPTRVVQLSMSQQPSLLVTSIRRGPYSQAPPTWKKPRSNFTQSGALAGALVPGSLHSLSSLISLASEHGPDRRAVYFHFPIPVKVWIVKTARVLGQEGSPRLWKQRVWLQKPPFTSM